MNESKYHVGQRVVITDAESIIALGEKDMHGGMGDGMPDMAGETFTIKHIVSPYDNCPHYGYYFKEDEEWVWDERLLSPYFNPITLPDDMFTI